MNENAKMKTGGIKCSGLKRAKVIEKIVAIRSLINPRKISTNGSLKCIANDSKLHLAQ